MGLREVVSARWGRKGGSLMMAFMSLEETTESLLLWPLWEDTRRGQPSVGQEECSQWEPALPEL